MAGAGRLLAVVIGGGSLMGGRFNLLLRWWGR